MLSNMKILHSNATIEVSKELEQKILDLVFGVKEVKPKKVKRVLRRYTQEEDAVIISRAMGG